jgi:hypothetical protein
VTEILRNPRYTGHQVWNRASGDRAGRSATGRRPTTRNDRHEWAVSTHVVHEPLVSEQDFLTVQTVRAEHPSADGGGHAYRLSGKLHCGLCGRRMDSHRVHDRPAYRCRHGHTSARTRPADAPGNLYLREDHLLARIAEYLAAADIATDPSLEETARLVGELDLAFRCDTNSIAPLTPPAAASRTKTTSGPLTGSMTRHFDPDPVEADEPAEDPDSGQLVLDLCFGSETVEPVVTGGSPRPAAYRSRRARTRRPPDARLARPSRPGRAPPLPAPAVRL